MQVSDRKIADTPARCTQTPDVAPGLNPMQNGIQIFPGGVPIYRGNQLVGARPQRRARSRGPGRR